MNLLTKYAPTALGFLAGADVVLTLQYAAAGRAYMSAACAALGVAMLAASIFAERRT